jgi:uncharacterized protein
MRTPRPRVALIAVASLALSACVFRPQVTRRFGFIPRPLAEARQHPVAWGFMDASLDSIPTTERGVTLNSWWIPSSRLPAKCGAALLLHGKGKNRAELAPLARALSASGFDVLVPDYRGFGGSGGVPTDTGLYADAEVSFAHLLQRSGVTPSSVVVLGHSLGTALAARLSRTHQPAATVYLSPFSSIARVTKARFGWIGTQLFDTTVFDFRPADDARHVTSKALVGIAGRDLLIPRSVADEFTSVLSPAPYIVTDSKASHNGVLESPMVIAAVTDSVRAWLSCPSDSRMSGAVSATAR